MAIASANNPTPESTVSGNSTNPGLALTTDVFSSTTPLKFVPKSEVAVISLLGVN